jgi:D-3-phosphoglycerate dehydrogenase / 2-oxoglutarate reductase
MKIAILNECFLNEDHLKRLRTLGDVQIFNNTTTKEDAIQRLRGVDIAIVDGFLAPLDKDVLASADNLQLLVLPHIGYFMVDLETANQKGIKVANAPGFSKESVAELVIGLMFAVNRKIVLGDRLVRNDPSFEVDPGNRDHDRYLGFDIRGKIMGRIGLGKVGSTLANLALGLGMRVVASNRSPRNMEGVEMVSLEDLLKKADVISINVTANKETENIISENELRLMKPNAILINVDQARQLDIEALYKSLKENRIGGAGVDVIKGIDKNHPILKLDNIVFTGHFGSSTVESFKQNLPEMVVSNIEEFSKGTPVNLLN